MNSDRLHHNNGQAAASILDRAAPSRNGHAKASRPGSCGAAVSAARAGATPAPQAPSTDGSNGAKPEAASSSAGGGSPDPVPTRDQNGRFAKGNAGGPGNPFARQVAALRQALLNAVTPADIQAIAVKLKTLAQEGNVPAAKLVLGYTLGKTAPATNPDRLDVEEWDGYKSEAPMWDEMTGLLGRPAAIMPLSIVRESRPAITGDLGKQLGGLLMMPPDRAASSLDRLETLPRDQHTKELRKLAEEMYGPAKAPRSPNGKKR